MFAQKLSHVISYGVEDAPDRRVARSASNVDITHTIGEERQLKIGREVVWMDTSVLLCHRERKQRSIAPTGHVDDIFQRMDPTMRKDNPKAIWR